MAETSKNQVAQGLDRTRVKPLNPIHQVIAVQLRRIRVGVVVLQRLHFFGERKICFYSIICLLVSGPRPIL